MNGLQKYRLACTLSFGDIYAQVIIWLIVIFLGLASSLALMAKPTYALLASGLVLVISLPFLLFAFVTTLLNHIELSPISMVESTNTRDKVEETLQKRPRAEAPQAS